MNISIKYGTEHLDWTDVCEIFRLAALGTRDPKKLRLAAENSHTVISACVNEELVGFGRAILDGQYQSAICDIVVFSELQNQGSSSAIMNALL